MTKIRTIIAIVVLASATTGQAQTYPSQLMSDAGSSMSSIRSLVTSSRSVP